MVRNTGNDPVRGKMLVHLLKAVRPAQWTKNGVLFAAFIFGYGDQSLDITLYDAIGLIPAFIAFCLATSTVYLCNDIFDRKHDQQHPVKKHRPIAAGRISPAVAIIAATLSASLAIIIAFFLSFAFMQVLVIYIALQILYSAVLKNVALLDVFIIAAGFVLRAIAGAVLLNIPISTWLLVCAFLLALFLALCKRRHEKASIEAGASARQRISLQKYDLQLTDQLIAIVSGATIVTYAIYTLWPETIEKFGSNRLIYTLPIVMFGIFRYLDLLYRENKGDRPEQVLLTDIPIICALLVYVTIVFSLFMNLL
jgi:4-hydroxybenzoate polyprenyltransferase